MLAFRSAANCGSATDDRHTDSELLTGRIDNGGRVVLTGSGVKLPGDDQASDVTTSWTTNVNVTVTNMPGELVHVVAFTNVFGVQVFENRHQIIDLVPKALAR